MKKYIFLIFCTAIFIQPGFAQDNRISINGQYNLPGGELKWVYNKVPGFQVNYSRLEESDTKKLISAFGVTIGYTQFTPLADTLYYLVMINEDDVGVGTAVYSDYKIFQLAASMKFERKLMKESSIQFGLEIGYYFTHFEYWVSDDLNLTDGREMEGKGALVPVVGMVFPLGEHFSLNPHFKFNLFFSLGNSDPNAPSYNPNVGSYNYFFSPGLSLHFNF